MGVADGCKKNLLPGLAGRRCELLFVTIICVD